MKRKKQDEAWEVHEEKNQNVKGEKAKARIWERLGELKETEEIPEKVQKTKRTWQEIAKPKVIEMTTEDLLQFEEGILVICDNTKEKTEDRRV